MRLARLTACLLLAATAPAGAAVVGAWAAAQQLVEPKNQPPAPGLSHATLRQVVRLTAGGTGVVVHLSNAFGRGPLSVAAADVATPAGPGRIDPATDHRLAFAGRTEVMVPPGTEVLSDPLPITVAAGSDLAVTVRFGNVPPDLTGHPGSRATSYLVAGTDPAAAELPHAATVAHWYVLAGVDVDPPKPTSAVVVLGDSITDGRGSTTDGNDRWPDDLARRLPGVAVLNAGIGGNRLLADGLGPSGLSRFDRDVAAAAGARWLLILEGVNDIGTGPGSDAQADRITSAYAQLVARGHRLGLKVYGGTILPFAGSAYDTPARAAERQRVNAWVRAPGHFDAVVDFDVLIRDPDHPDRLRPDADSGDHLHPSPAGYRRMADGVDPGLFHP